MSHTADQIVSAAYLLTAKTAPHPSEALSSLIDNELALVRGGGAAGVESGGTVLSPDRNISVDRAYRK